MPTLQFSLEKRGPVFDKGKGKKIINNVTKAFVQRIVELGEQRLRAILRPRPAGVYLSAQEAGPQKSVGHYSRNISSETLGLTGKIEDGDVIYGPWLEGTSSRNAATQFKGYASFRKTKDWMQKQIGKQRKEFEKKYARKLNGI